MKVTHDDNLTLYLSGRIDANNSAETETAIANELTKFPGEVPAFDASELEYISSAGLRVLLKFRKQFDRNIDILNVSNEVYDIFEVTGFTELLNVRKRLRNVSIDGCPVIGGGAFSTVYRLNADTIVKVFDRRPLPLSRIESDQQIARKVFLQDIPTAISFDVVRVGEHYGIVYEMIDADSMSRVIMSHPERLRELTVKAAKLFRQLHRTDFEAGTFPDGRQDMIDNMKRLNAEGFISAQDAELACEVVNRLPYRTTFLHRDYHTGNILVKGDELILIDVGEAAQGDPVIDLASTYMHMILGSRVTRKAGEQASAMYEKIIGISHKATEDLWSIFVPEYFGTTDTEKLERYSRILHGYGLMYMMPILSDIPILTDEQRAAAISGCMKELRDLSGILGTIEGI